MKTGINRYAVTSVVVILAIGIGDYQIPEAATARDVGDARPRQTFLTGELFVDQIADLVRDRPQLVWRHVKGQIQQRGALRAGQLELHDIATGAAGLSLAGDGVIRP